MFLPYSVLSSPFRTLHIWLTFSVLAHVSQMFFYDFPKGFYVNIFYWPVCSTLVFTFAIKPYWVYKFYINVQLANFHLIVYYWLQYLSILHILIYFLEHNKSNSTGVQKMNSNFCITKISIPIETSPRFLASIPFCLAF